MPTTLPTPWATMVLQQALENPQREGPALLTIHFVDVPLDFSLGQTPVVDILSFGDHLWVLDRDSLA